MYKEKLGNERFLRVYFIDGELVVDVNSDIWEKILSQKEKILKIECHEWSWDLLTGKVVLSL